MKFEEFFAKTSFVYANIVFIIAGLLISGISVLSLFSKTEYAQTQATIVEIEEYYDMTDISDDASNRINHRVYVDYAADGMRFRHAELGAYSSSMKEGDEITIEYDTSDPSHIQSKGANKIVFVTIPVGFAVAAFGIVRLKLAKKELKAEN